MFDQFKNLKSLAQIMGNAGEFQEKFRQLSEQLSTKTVEADTGAGAVRVVMNCRFELLDLKLDPAMIATFAGEGDQADREMVEELIRSAVNAAHSRAKELFQQEMAKLTGGLNIPGLDQLMNQ